MRAISPAIMRGLEGLPQEQIAVQLAARLGVKPSVVNDYLMKGPQPKPEPMVTCRKEWSGMFENGKQGGALLQQKRSSERRQRVLAMADQRVPTQTIANTLGIDVSTVRRFIRERDNEIKVAAIKPAPKVVTCATIKQAVSDVTGFSLEDLESFNRKPPVVLARQVAFWLAVRDLGMSTPMTGARFKRDHTTVLHGVGRIDAEQEFPQVAELIGKVRARIQELVA